MMLSTGVKSEVAYQPLCKEEVVVPLQLNWKQKWLPCGTFTRRMYIMAVLCAVVVVWIFIYYKLLHHHFELPEPLRELRKMFGDGEVKKRRGREEETEIVTIATEVPRCLPQFRNERSSNVLHFAIVACDDQDGDALLTMKSIVLFTNYNVYFHIFTNERHIKEKTFDKVLKTWPAWREHWLMFTVHPVRYTVNEDKQDWFKQYKPCASQSLFLAKILVDVDALVYVKPDIVFLDAPENLWNIFNKLNVTQIAGVTDECGEDDSNCHYTNILPYPYLKPYGMSSNIMLMNLTRMRQLRWQSELVAIYSKYKKQLAYGDQDILNIYFASRTPSLYKLGCEWNYRPQFCTNRRTCRWALKKNGVRALHRGGDEEMFGNADLKDFLATFVEYKFEENFTDKFLNVLHSKMSSLLLKYDAKSCGNLVENVLKRISC